MKSIKCPKCGLVNFASEHSCKKCRSPLAEVNNGLSANFSESASKNDHPLKMTRNVEIGLGVVLAISGLFLIIANFITATYYGNFGTGSTFLAPVALASGLGILLVPYPNKENFGEAKMPNSWAVFILVGVGFGILNWCYFMFA